MVSATLSGTCRPFAPNLKLEVTRMINEQGQSIQSLSESMRVGHTAIQYRLQHYRSEQSGQPAIDKPLTAKLQRIRKLNWRSNTFGRMSPY